MRKLYLFLSLFFTTFFATAQWNTNIAVNLDVAEMTVADMQTAFTSDGKTWIAFYNAVTGGYVMRAQLLDINGRKLLGPNGVVVNSKPSGTATYVFNVALDAAGNLIIASQDQRNGSSSNVAVVHKVAQDGTLLWGADGVVLGTGLSPYVAVLSTGETVAGWSESASNTLNLQKIAIGGNLGWSSPVQVRVGSTRTSRGQIVGGSGGTFTVVFQRAGVGISTTLFAQRYANNGTAMWSAPVQLSNQTSSGARYYSMIAENDTTYFGYYVSQGSRFNSFVQRINPDGTLPYGLNGAAFSTNQAPADAYQQTTNMMLVPGSPYVWSVCSYSNTLQSQYGVYVQKFLKSTGARQLGNTAKEVYPISANMDQQSGQLSVVNDNPMFMSYDKDYRMYVTRLDAIGNFIWPGNRVEISSTTAGLATPKGRFGFIHNIPNNLTVATWTETRAGELRAYAQNIAPSGLIGLKVATLGSVPAAITTNAGTLALTSVITPASANQAVNWFLIPVTGTATINGSGVVTARTNGTVWAKAVSVIDTKIKDSILITISNQTIVATGLKVSTLNGVVPEIRTSTDNLQMVATITPANATFRDVTWHLTPVTGKATISATGLVEPLDDGTVWATAVSVQYPNLKDSMLITIGGQRADHILSGIIIYPVPTRDVVHLKLLKNHLPTLMWIVDATGRVVYEEKLAENALRQEKTINLAGLAAGTYFIRFQAGWIWHSFKIMKL
ncbi:MAG: T9SS type A sorting domain-containing protein [Chitinophagaceae bacterium]